MKMQIALACRNASGEPEIPVFTVTATQSEYDEGVHYNKAEALAQDAGYEGPFIGFDASEHKAIVLALRSLGLMESSLK